MSDGMDTLWYLRTNATGVCTLCTANYVYTGYLTVFVLVHTNPHSVQLTVRLLKLYAYSNISNENQ